MPAPACTPPPSRQPSLPPSTCNHPPARAGAACEAFASRLFDAHVAKTHALETLVIASFVRGLSVRDVEAALAEALGDQAAISKSTVSSVCQQIDRGLAG